MHRPAMRTVGLEFGAIEFGEQFDDFADFEGPPGPHRTVAGERFQQVLEGRFSARTKAVLTDTVDHLDKQSASALYSEDRWRPAQQERRRAEGLDLKAERANFG